MRFKRFLEESDDKPLGNKYRKEIPIDEALKLLKAHCGDALKLAKPLFRGMTDTSDNDEGVYLVHAEGSVRKSANTSNYYTLILDHFLPSQGFPKRSEAIIFSNNYNTARGFGDIFAIFPYDGVKIGVCAYDDLWDTPAFKIGNSDEERLIQSWNRFWGNLDLSQSSYLEFVDGIKEKMESQTVFADHLIGMFGTPDNVEPVLEDAYSKEKLRLHVATTKNIDDFDGARELWTGGKCIAIRLTLWDKIKNAGEDK